MPNMTRDQLRAISPAAAQALDEEDKRRASRGSPPVSYVAPLPDPVVPEAAPSAKRIRQKEKKMNKTETDFFLHLQNMTAGKIRYNELRFELANNTHLKPDFTVDARTVYEAKGPWASRDAFVRLKVAARLWPEFTWFLATRKKEGGWDIQHILP